MSNEEARERLKYVLEDGNAMSNKTRAAVEVAVEALEENQKLKAMVDELAEKPQKGYEYHYDHTDCIWYRVGGKVKCPVTCSQYRDGWNDAMNYIFKNGEGYKPYRRG